MAAAEAALKRPAFGFFASAHAGRAVIHSCGRGSGDRGRHGLRRDRGQGPRRRRDRRLEGKRQLRRPALARRPSEGDSLRGRSWSLRGPGPRRSAERRRGAAREGPERCRLRESSRRRPRHGSLDPVRRNDQARGARRPRRARQGPAYEHGSPRFGEAHLRQGPRVVQGPPARCRSVASMATIAARSRAERSSVRPSDGTTGRAAARPDFARGASTASARS